MVSVIIYMIKIWANYSVRISLGLLEKVMVKQSPIKLSISIICWSYLIYNVFK